MEAKRSVVPAICVVVLGFAWFFVHRSGASEPDPANDARRALVQECAQRNTTPTATWCVPDGWKLEERPPGPPSDAPNIESTARDNSDALGGRLHLNGPTGYVAQIQVTALPDVPDDVADNLGDDASAASRQAAITGLLARGTQQNGFGPAADGAFLPPGTVPHAEVYATSVGTEIPTWFVFRGKKRISIMGLRGLVGDGMGPGGIAPLDLGAVTPAIERILATWTWRDDWADAPNPLDREQLKNWKP